VKVRSKLNIDLQTICEELHSVFGLKAPPKITIEKWFYEYQKKKVNITRSRKSSTEEVCSRIDSTLRVTTNHTEVTTSMDPGLDKLTIH
jgi:hypothetical protein